MEGGSARQTQEGGLTKTRKIWGEERVTRSWRAKGGKRKKRRDYNKKKEKEGP